MSNTASVLLGNGNGTFQAKQSFGTGSRPQLSCGGRLQRRRQERPGAADCDGNTVSVLLGNGNGTFQAKQSFGTGRASVSRGGRFQRRRQERPGHRGLQRQHRERAAGQRQRHVSGQAVLRHGNDPDAVAVADFNGDGKSDLVTADWTTTPRACCLATATARFRPEQSFGTGNRPCSVAVGDFNGDGVKDLVTADYNGNTASVLLGNGTTTDCLWPPADNRGELGHASRRALGSRSDRRLPG